MVVIYAEKSSLAKVIASTLNAGKRMPLPDEPTVGYYQFKFKGEDAILCHGVGHLAGLVPAKSYDEKYAKWDLEAFPCIPKNFKKAPKSTTLKCIKLIKGFLDKADWAINATDPDREGELIFTYVAEVCRFQKEIKRVWIEDLTDEKINFAFNNLKSKNEQLSSQAIGTAENLQKAGRARDISDWLIGNNLTVAFTKKYGGYDNLLSLGRVQTPTLAMIVNREKIITSHVKTPFWKVIANFGEFEAEHEHGNFENENEAKNILANCVGKGVVLDKQVKNKNVSAPLLFNATQLQIATNKKFGWDAEKTAKVMQSLYEAKLMSYPRTSSEHLTEAMIPEVELTLQKIFRTDEYSNYLPEKWEKFTNRHFDDKKVGSHTAIIPTVNVPDNLNKLSEDEKILYDLLVKSLIRTVYPKAELQETAVVIAVNGEKFKANGSVITNPGWYIVDAMPEKKNTLPLIEKDMEFEGKYSLKKGETEPPKRFTEATLLSAMELAGANIEDEEIRTMMKMQKKGLGTDATRVSIIKSLFDRNYIERKGKSIIPTEKGNFIINTLPLEEIKSAELTGDLEKKLNDIYLGVVDFDDFINEIKETTRSWYDVIAKSEGKVFEKNENKLSCPFCGKSINTFKWGYGCSGYKEGCKFSFNNEICGKKISETQANALITKGKTALIKGFKGKTGKEFNAKLILNKKEFKIDFEFEKIEKK
ncbi:MAG: topoisomerase C-terminal repeat-containing protein [Bacteroidales bacterium]|nr:topoisomerase C-terminal repeat-containing protein [Bacteroidales bacterium]